MRRVTQLALALFFVAFATIQLTAEPAMTVLGKDYTFPNRIDGLPGKLSDFPDLQINSFMTSDGVKLTYWEAGEGKPLIFIPGWSANGAEYINLMYLLRKHYHVYVLDLRNQGLSARLIMAFTSPVMRKTSRTSTSISASSRPTTVDGPWEPQSCTATSICLEQRGSKS